MAVSKANQRAVNKYVKANYDRINVTMPKGKKDAIQAAAEAQGQSVNAYINTAIDGRMAPETAQEAAGGAQKAGAVSLPSDTIKAAREAAEVAGEALSEFVTRAVTAQAKRDQTALSMGIHPVTGEPLKKEGAGE